MNDTVEQSAIRPQAEITTEGQTSILEKAISAPLTPEKIKVVQDLLKNKGMVEEAILTAQKRVEESKKALNALSSLNSDVLDQLNQVSNQIFDPLGDKLSVKI